jgi:hypothetical protein
LNPSPAGKIEGSSSSEDWGFPGFSMVWGYPNSWMVYFMENPIKMDDFGVPHSRKPPSLHGQRHLFWVQ